MQPLFCSFMELYLVPLKKYDFPLLVNNVGWPGLLSVVCLGGQRTLGCGGVK